MSVIVNCRNCEKTLKVKPSKMKSQKNVFCSRKCKYDYQKGKPTWNKGLKLPPLTTEHKRKIGLGVQSNPDIRKNQFKKGHKLWDDKERLERRKETIQKTGCLSGENNGMFGKIRDKNPNWQGGISYWRKEYYNSIPYKKWQKEVFKRDNYRCQICNSTKKERKILHAHHIKSFARYHKLRLKSKNGVTLCNECHSLVHSKKIQIGKILSIKKTKQKIDMIDIEIKDNNNFFANGILVHNSATPYREDGRTNYVFALTGYPVGLGWQDLMKILGKKYHEVTVYIVRDLQSKINLASQLINKNWKTVIFVNLLDIGKRMADLLGVPFIHGETRDRMNLARQSKIFVASRVLELGVSLKDLEHIIEVDFLFGSRREEVQRTGRLFHSEEAKRHDIIMTKEEFEQYGKRLHGLKEKGFFIQLRPMVSGIFELKPVEEKVIEISPSEKIIKELFAIGWFKEHKGLSETMKEIKRRGMKPRMSTIYSKLLDMVKEGRLFHENKKFVEREFA